MLMHPCPSCFTPAVGKCGAGSRARLRSRICLLTEFREIGDAVKKTRPWPSSRGTRTPFKPFDKVKLIAGSDGGENAGVVSAKTDEERARPGRPGSREADVCWSYALCATVFFLAAGRFAPAGFAPARFASARGAADGLVSAMGWRGW